MNRRNFCKIASLTVGALGLGSFPAIASPTRTPDHSPLKLPLMPPPGCRITILRRECHQDLQALFLDDPDTGPCQAFTPGEEHAFTSGQACPEGFCPRLWQATCSAIANPACAASLHEGTMLLSCPDGTRPVIVRIDINNTASE